jgi:hypothetical protein
MKQICKKCKIEFEAKTKVSYCSKNCAYNINQAINERINKFNKLENETNN